jgi:hypothetical protein
MSMADFPFQYAAKFLCTANIPGTSQTTTSLLPGSYQTVVNIHNPNSTTIRFRMKLALASFDNPQISNFIENGLKPDQAGKVDCSDVQKFDLHLIHGFEGFLVIESTHSLDVVAVYTAGTKQGVTSMDVERVFERYLT